MMRQDKKNRYFSIVLSIMLTISEHISTHVWVYDYDLQKFIRVNKTLIKRESSWKFRIRTHNVKILFFGNFPGIRDSASLVGFRNGQLHENIFNVIVLSPDLCVDPFELLKCGFLCFLFHISKMLRHVHVYYILVRKKVCKLFFPRTRQHQSYFPFEFTTHTKVRFTIIIDVNKTLIKTYIFW